MKKIIIILSGGFDPVHKGHVRMFQAAKEFPAYVVVGLNSNSWLQRKKGKQFMDWDERKEILSAMSCIDEVHSFNDDDGTACDIIKRTAEKFQSEDVEVCFGNGGDRTSGNSPEVEYCRKNNIKIIWDLGGEKIQSSSTLIDNSKK